MGLQGNVIEIIGKDIFSGISLQAIIAMGVDGIEEALRIQDGYSPFDMKPGFLRSPKAKKSKEGKKYFIMSFRNTVPGGAGIAGKVMSPSVHKAAMNKMIGNQIQRGSRFSDQMGTKEDPSDFGLINSRGYEWQNGPYAGMTNIVSSKEGKKHSVYRTFRVISEKSDQDSWWHPGMESNDVIGSTVKYVTPYIAEGLKRAAKSEVINKINKIFSHPISV
ncbi:MAG: hypothetical protein JSU85_08565 [Candidatus Zixiibacteriota bacterium]|nr:MAG: hypothetical protein JSU85_08565 [candidate division Zixibacteria bacterium]